MKLIFFFILFFSFHAKSFDLPDYCGEMRSSLIDALTKELPKGSGPPLPDSLKEALPGILKELNNPESRNEIGVWKQFSTVSTPECPNFYRCRGDGTLCDLEISVNKLGSGVSAMVYKTVVFVIRWDFAKNAAIHLEEKNYCRGVKIYEDKNLSWPGFGQAMIHFAINEALEKDAHIQFADLWQKNNHRKYCENHAQTVTLYDDCFFYFVRKLEKNHSEIVKILIPVASALRYLNQNKIIHGDVKRANILIRNKDKIEGFIADYDFTNPVGYAPGSDAKYFYHDFNFRKNSSTNSLSDVYGFVTVLLESLYDTNFYVDKLDLEAIIKQVAAQNDELSKLILPILQWDFAMENINSDVSLFEKVSLVVYNSLPADFTPPVLVRENDEVFLYEKVVVPLRMDPLVIKRPINIQKLKGKTLGKNLLLKNIAEVEEEQAYTLFTKEGLEKIKAVRLKIIDYLPSGMDKKPYLDNFAEDFEKLKDQKLSQSEFYKKYKLFFFLVLKDYPEKMKKIFEVLGFSSPDVPNALEFWDNYLKIAQ